MLVRFKFLFGMVLSKNEAEFMLHAMDGSLRTRADLVAIDPEIGEDMSDFMISRNFFVNPSQRPEPIYTVSKSMNKLIPYVQEIFDKTYPH